MVLCQRGRGGFALTTEGKQIYEAGLRMLAALDEFRGEVDGVHQRLRGSISLAIFDKTITNPKAFIGRCLQLFDDIAPDVTLELYIEPINEIERAVIDGRIQVGIIPSHRSSSSLDYMHLYDEQMYLYCGQDHPLFNAEPNTIDQTTILDHKYAGQSYHSPNMEQARTFALNRQANANDQEAIAMLILSGRYIGYLPEHYARNFVDQYSMRVIGAGTFEYPCQFSAITRRSPKPSRLTHTFLQTLRQAHSL
jgi:DNA-binding transcriptional LysR family regulator